MPSNWPFTFRLVTFATTILLSVIVMSLSADLVSIYAPDYYKFSALALAISLLTILTVTPMFIVDKLREGSIFSYATILWILWLTSGAYAAWTEDGFLREYTEEATCQYYGRFGAKNSLYCHETKAVIGFSFILWILLMAYTVTLLVLTLRAKERGHPAWTVSVRDGVLLHPAEKTTGSAIQLTTIPQSYSQAPPIRAPYYPSPAQHSLSMSVSPSIPQV
ncbi:hypothetical protein BC826DRAFT_1101218 [Russula brevipes]|nr:hypothetical protein BC826DRAFT_1101218 [Russula brevipes]